MKSNIRQCAVLSGDLVRSSRLDADDIKCVMHELRGSTIKINDVFFGLIFGKMDVYSGDAWQILLTDIKYALRVSLILRAAVKGLDKPMSDTRISMAFGQVDLLSVNPERISESTGDVFVRSGRALANMDKHRRLVLETEPDHSENRLFAAALGLIDEIVKGWTSAQSRTILLALLDYSQEEIAKHLDKAPPTIHKSLMAAGWRGVETFLVSWEK